MLVIYRYSSKTINLYISKIPNNVRYFDMYKLSFIIKNLYRNLSKDFNLYISKTPRNVAYLYIYKLSSTM
jgi:hypothetical protein